MTPRTQNPPQHTHHGAPFSKCSTLLDALEHHQYVGTWTTRIDVKIFRLLTPFDFSPLLDCTDKLRQNDPGFVELCLERVGEDFSLEEFCHALTVNQTVRHVCFSGTFVRELAPGAWRTLLEHIGHLTTLEELQVWCSTIPVDVLAHTLRASRRLDKLYLFRVNLAGAQPDFDELASALRSHSTLRDIRISGFQLVEQTDMPTAAARNDTQQVRHASDVSLDTVMEALAAVRTLEVLSLQLSGLRESQMCPFAGPSLARLMCSSTIRDLYLSRLGLGQDHYGAIALGIRSSHNLKVLDLFSNTMENEHVRMIAHALGDNQSIETFVLPCPEDELSLASCAAIAQAIKLNETLVTLNLPKSILSEEGLKLISDALTVNKTIKKLELGLQDNLGAKATHSLENMLQLNYHLQRLVLSSADKSVKDKVEYYLRLNEVGRGSLLKDGTATREQWVTMLISVSEDLDCLFYFCSCNPGLFQFANTRNADVIVTEEFRPQRRHTIDNFTHTPHCNKESIVPLYKGLRRASAL